MKDNKFGETATISAMNVSGGSKGLTSRHLTRRGTSVLTEAIRRAMQPRVISVPQSEMLAQTSLKPPMPNADEVRRVRPWRGTG